MQKKSLRQRFLRFLLDTPRKAFYIAFGVVFTISISSAFAAWNSTKASGDLILASDWNDLVTYLGTFGTAATKNVGTAANNIIQLDANAKIPAVDGSQLTGLAAGAPTNYITGLSFYYATTTTYTVNTGKARDGADSEDISLTSALTKSLSAWAAGTGNGSLDTGSVAINTYYYVWLIKKTDKSAVDVLLSASATAPTMPSGYTYKRVIGRLRTNTASQINANIMCSANPANVSREIWTLSDTGGLYYETPWPSSFSIEVQGGGAGGGGSSSGGIGSPGGGGSWSTKVYKASPADSVLMTIGAGGNAGTWNNSPGPTAGGASSFGTYITVPG
nr:hypothetical protein [Candidatus Gracilibacteria bacterium]